ncbi:hypothetical protein P3T76_011380 [Phytophthora citrophthora]|uniref:Uncharacterized protein n=1 Tax=Phytophthora citrophthora TaxID=4793 RepID=A0AAD9LFY8_9STRA|nr:hypothetical protein P3T76_011380 [Phytophthora citrophthora]
MAFTLGALSPTLLSSEDPSLSLDDLDAAFVLADAEALLIEEFHPLSPISASDQDAEELPPHNKTRRMTKPSRRQSYRIKEKRERAELKRQVVNLNEEVVRLRHIKANEKAQFNASRTSTFWFWKAVATRQRHERSQAEDEQRALTLLAHAQAAYIQTLAISEQDQPVRHLKKQRCGVSEIELFDAIIQDLDTNCAPADELFRTCRTTPPLQVLKPDGTLGYSQFYTTESTPFSISLTCHLLWELGTRHHCHYQDYKRYADVRDPENTNAQSYRSTVTLENGVKVSVRNRLVARRYNKERVSSWKLVCEGEGVYNGFQFDETVWITLRASELGTVIEMFIRRTPMHFTSTMLRDRERFEQAMHRLLDQTRGDILTSLQGVLVDDVVEQLVG